MGVDVRVTNELIVGGRTWQTPWFFVPGQAAGDLIYDANDSIGTDWELTLRSQSGIIQSVLVLDRAKQSIALDIFLFRDRLVTKPVTDTAFDLDDADDWMALGVIPVAASDYAAMSDSSLATVRNVGLAFVAPLQKLYGVCVTRGTPTYVAVTDLRLSFVILEDANPAAEG